MKKELLLLNLPAVRKLLAIFGIFCAVCSVSAMANADTAGLGRFSFGAKAGIQFAPKAENFEATYSSGLTTTRYTLEGEGFVVLSPYFRYGFTKNFGVEAAYGYESGDNLAVQTVSASAVYMFTERRLRPYVKAGLLWGKFTYDNLPGSFDGDIGWLIGAGFEAGGERASFVMDLLYRSLTNKYNKASGFVRGSDEIDLGGIGVLVGFVIRF